jgi:DNA-binding NarL/FixJ family response regulator
MRSTAASTLTDLPIEDTGPLHRRESSTSRLSAKQVADPAGLILLNHAGDHVYINSVAQAVLCFPGRSTSDRESSETVRTQIRSRLLPMCSKSGGQGSFVSGRRTYFCRTLVLETGTSQDRGANMAILLERSSRRNENFRRLCERYKLTPRERQAVILLTDGLTSKEIAQRMNISAHTVKGFVHLIMVKLGVTTRSGIVGKINGS